MGSIDKIEDENQLELAMMIIDSLKRSKESQIL